jgi:predicted dehydrogenase
MIQKYTDQKVTIPDIVVQHSVFGYPKGFAFESIRSFVDCILSGDPFKVSVRDAANTSLAILAIIESAKTRNPVEVRY